MHYHKKPYVCTVTGLHRNWRRDFFLGQDQAEPNWSCRTGYGGENMVKNMNITTCTIWSHHQRHGLGIHGPIVWWLRLIQNSFKGAGFCDVAQQFIPILDGILGRMSWSRPGLGIALENCIVIFCRVSRHILWYTMGADFQQFCWILLKSLLLSIPQ